MAVVVFAAVVVAVAIMAAVVVVVAVAIMAATGIVAAEMVAEGETKNILRTLPSLKQLFAARLRTETDKLDTEKEKRLHRKEKLANKDSR